MCKIPIEYHLHPSNKGYSYEYLQQGEIDWLSIYSSLINAHVISGSSEIIRYEENSPWERGGAETYICSISLAIFQNEHGLRKEDVIIKALVSPVRNLLDYAKEWTMRAEILEGFGVKTGVYGTDKGCVYQHYMHDSLFDLVQQCVIAEDLNRFRSILESLFLLGSRIALAGFRPQKILADLRILENNIALVDLGEDLGYSTSICDIKPVLRLIENELIKFNEITLMPEEFTQAVYEYGKRWSI